MHLLKTFIRHILVISIVIPVIGYSSPADSLKALHLDRARENAAKLMSLQNKTNHLWKRAGWWNSANIFESLIDYHRLTGQDFSAEIKKIYRHNLLREQTKYVSPVSFDDNEWWALTWFKAYKVTGEKKYLAVTEHIFRDMVRRSWNAICGGGMEWKVGKEYKNAVTNELFISLAARLALESKDSGQKKVYADWAVKEWLWFKNSHLLIRDSLWVSDGLQKDCSAVINPGLDLTYNQGIILGSLTYLYQLTGDKEYLAMAKQMAYGSMKKYSNDLGVLSEHGKPNSDKIQFKGIYMRNLAILNTELHDELIKQFILFNADHAWQHCRSSDGLCDFNWSGPYTDWSGAAQGSVMDLLNAALMQE